MGHARQPRTGPLLEAVPLQAVPMPGAPLPDPKKFCLRNRGASVEYVELPDAAHGNYSDAKRVGSFLADSGDTK